MKKSFALIIKNCAALMLAALLCALAGCGEDPAPEPVPGKTVPAPVSESELALIKEAVAAFERWDNDRLVCALDHDAPENAEAFAELVKERGDNVVDTVLVTCCKTKGEARAHAARYLGGSFEVPDDAVYEFGGRLYALVGAKGYVEYRINDPSRVARQSDGTVYVPAAWYGSGGEYGGEDVFIMRFEDGAYKTEKHIASD